VKMPLWAFLALAAFLAVFGYWAIVFAVTLLGGSQ